VGAF